MLWKNHPIYDGLDIGNYLNGLKSEYLSRPASERLRVLGRAFLCELLMHVRSQAALRKKRMPRSARRILWVYDDVAPAHSIMDLSQRFVFGAGIQIDLCMSRGPAELFQGDTRFAHVYRCMDECADAYDFIILHSFSPGTLLAKIRRYPDVPFAGILDHLQGERFARTEISAIRLGRLLGKPIQPLYRPAIALPVQTRSDAPSGRIVVALGNGHAICDNNWPELLETIQRHWRPEWPGPEFTLIGRGTSARETLRKFPESFRARCTIKTDQPDLMETARTIAEAELFLSADSDFVQIAESLRKPGLCLLAGLPPEWQLPSDSSLHAVYADGSDAKFQPQTIAGHFISQASRVYKVSSCNSQTEEPSAAAFCR